MNPQAATLRLAVFPRSGLATDALLVAAGAGLVALAAQIEIMLAFTPVPISGQTFAVLLVGASYGPVLGASSLLLYFFVGLLGAPVYSGGDSGWTIVKGATGGYLVGFIVAALLTGWLAQRQWDRRFNSAVAAMLSGSVVIYPSASLARAHGEPRSGGDARGRPLPVRRRRSPQALPRRRAASGRLEARPPPPRVRRAPCFAPAHGG